MMELELVLGCQALEGEVEERSAMGMVRKTYPLNYEGIALTFMFNTSR